MDSQSSKTQGGAAVPNLLGSGAVRNPLAIGSGLWETVGMAKLYIPKVNDTVFMNGQNFVRYVVIKVDEEVKRADVQMVSGAMTLHRNVSWPEFYELDESQNAARIVREATGDV